jgi:2-C-methyl-D-erythritol 4-phosphate cytidylyltransferase
MSDLPGSDLQSLKDVTLIVPAAGIGSRMSASKPKQYLSIAGKPILAHTLKKLLQLNPRKIVLVVSAQDHEFESIEFVDRCDIVIGGSSRSASVSNGLASLDCDADDWVMVHDCARPCVRTADILELYNRLRNTDVGGILAVPVSDTLKKIVASHPLPFSEDAQKKTLQASSNETVTESSSETIRIQETLDRSELWLAQTPQMFRFGMLKQALDQAIESEIEITDEASAIEASGQAPEIVEGSKDNIKITTQEDLLHAAYILSQQESIN